MPLGDYVNQTIRVRAERVEIVPRAEQYGGGRGLKCYNIVHADTGDSLAHDRIIRYTRDMENIGIRDGVCVEFTVTVRENKHFRGRYEISNPIGFEVL